MLCCVCLLEAEHTISVCDDLGKHLSIAEIISKHFWFKHNDILSSHICTICWDKIDDFHKFYEIVEKTHKEFQHIQQDLAIMKEEDNYINPESIKQEDVASDDQNSINIEKPMQLEVEIDLDEVKNTKNPLEENIENKSSDSDSDDNYSNEDGNNSTSSDEYQPDVKVEIKEENTKNTKKSMKNENKHKHFRSNTMSSKTPRHSKSTRGKTLKEKIAETRGESFDFVQSLSSTEDRDGFQMDELECELPQCIPINTIEINPSIMEIEGAGALELAAAQTSNNKRHRENISQTDSSVTLKRGDLVSVDELMEILSKLVGVTPGINNQIKFHKDDINWTIHFPGSPTSPDHKKSRTLQANQCTTSNRSTPSNTEAVDSKNSNYIKMLDEGIKCPSRTGSSKSILLTFKTIKMSRLEIEEKCSGIPPAESFVKFISYLINDKPQIRKALALYILPTC